MPCQKFVHCAFEFRLGMDQARLAAQNAVAHAEDKAPYGIPTYPFVWLFNQEHQSIRLNMGFDEGGRKYTALFSLDHSPVAAGVLVHVSVFITPKQETTTKDGQTVTMEWAAQMTMDTRHHVVAVNHFKGCLLGAVGGAKYVAQVGPTEHHITIPDDPLPPPPDDEPLPAS